MKLTTVLIPAFLGLSTALPVVMEREASASASLEDKRAIGWFGASVIGGIVAPFISRLANTFFDGPKKRSSDETWDQKRRSFLQASVNGIFNADVSRDGDAAVCTGVGYSVSSPARTVDSYSFAIGEGDQRQEYDCFILTGPSTFTVDPKTPDTQIAVKVGKNGKFENGVVTLI